MRDTQRYDPRPVMRIPILLTLLTVVLIGGLSRPSSVAAQTYVIDESAGTGGNGALFRVDPTTGARTLLSDFGVGANPGVDPDGMAVSSPSAAGIPTLSEWAQIGMAVLLLGGGLLAIRKRSAFGNQRSA